MKKVLVAVCLVVMLGCWEVGIAEELVIDASLSQEEINLVIDGASLGDVVVIEAGDYGMVVDDNGVKRNYNKAIIVEKEGLIFEVKGEYKSFQLVVRADSSLVVRGETVFDGRGKEWFSSIAALAIQSGELVISSLGNELRIVNYNNGIRLGMGESASSSKLVLDQDSKILIRDSYLVRAEEVSYDRVYYDSYNDHGDRGVNVGYDEDGVVRVEGSMGSGIYVHGQGGKHYISLEENSSLVVQNSGNAGIYIGSNLEALNSVFIELDKASLIVDSNKGSGLWEEDFGGSYYLTAVDSNVSFSYNAGRGMVGHERSSIVLDNSSLYVDNNKGLGIDEAIIMLDGSVLSASYNNGHGVTNVGIEAIDSVIEVSNNLYLGLNVTKYNSSVGVTLLDNTVINASNNGGSGIRIYAVMKEESGVYAKTEVVNGSVIKANNNGIGDSVYGYGVKAVDSGYWADVVVKGELVSLDSSILCNTYSLYDVSGDRLPSYFKVGKNMVITVDKQDLFATAQDIFNEGSMVVDGRTYVYGGSLQGELWEMTNGYDYEWNGMVSEGVDYAGPINLEGTKLVKFSLNKEINKVVNLEESNSFVYFDPNTKERYDYQFRYNDLGEDLEELESGNAYVWAPVSLIKYDATEGYIDYIDSTAGSLVVGDSVAFQGNNRNVERTESGQVIYSFDDDKEIFLDKYAYDVTIFGNSLELAEKRIASGVREGYRFEGWYVPLSDNIDWVAELVENARIFEESQNFEEALECWEAVNELLVIPFTSSSKVIADLEDEMSGLGEMTVYAKWTRMGKVMVQYQDQEGNNLRDYEVLEDEVGEEYQAIFRDIEGYSLVSIIGGVEGEYEEEMVVVTYIYEPVEEVMEVNELPPKTGIVIARGKEIMLCLGLLIVGVFSGIGLLKIGNK